MEGLHIRRVLLLAILGWSSTLWAADPLVGTWKLNTAKSRFSPAILGNQAPFREAIMTIREVDGQIEILYKGTRTDGSSVLQQSTVPREGGVLKYQRGGPGDRVIVIFTRFDAHNGCFTRLQNSKQVYVNVTFISRDGKTQQDNYKGTDARGKPFEQIVIYERQ
jgi:hypothetical protein